MQAADVRFERVDIELPGGRTVYVHDIDEMLAMARRYRALVLPLEHGFQQRVVNRTTDTCQTSRLLGPNERRTIRSRNSPDFRRPHSVWGGNTSSHQDRKSTRLNSSH